jgi:hypothetical protein
MKVYLQSSGGFMGIDDSVSLDTETMNSEEAKKVRELVDNANFFALSPESEKPKPGSADYIRYKITVEDGEHKHTVRTNDITKPAKLGHLIPFLKSKKV